MHDSPVSCAHEFWLTRVASELVCQPLSFDTRSFPARSCRNEFGSIVSPVRVSSPTWTARYFWEEEWEVVYLTECARTHQEQPTSMSVFFLKETPLFALASHRATTLPRVPNVDSGCVDESQKPRHLVWSFAFFRRLGQKHSFH